MSAAPSRQARLAHAARHAELWNAGKKDEWVASRRTICRGGVRMFDPVGTQEKQGFQTATSDAFDMFQAILKIKVITVQVQRQCDGMGLRELFSAPGPMYKWLTASKLSRGMRTGIWL